MASDQPRVMDAENLGGLINTIMSRHQLRPRDIRGERRYQDVSGWGEFNCKLCCETRKVLFSWIRVDLFDQRICKRWIMKCQNCLTPNKPTFSQSETEKLIEKAVCRYKGIPFRTQARKSVSGRTLYFPEPHPPTLCEKCEWGAIQCWDLYFRRRR